MNFSQEHQQEIEQLHQRIATLESQLESALSLEEDIRKLSRAVEQSVSSIVITNLEGVIEFVNPAFCKQTGYTMEEIHGQHTRILKSGETEPEVYRELWDTISVGEVWQGELLNKRKDGTLFWEAVKISPVKDDQGVTTHYLAIKTDITNRKNADIQLHQYRVHLEELVESRTAELTAINKQFQRELDMAHKIQASLLPPPKPAWSALDVVCYTIPARQVGGDLYVYREFDMYARRATDFGRELADENGKLPSKYALAVGDVSGKGMPAALLMGMSVVLLESYARPSLRPSRLLSHLDRAILPYTKTTQQNCALIYMELTPPVLVQLQEKMQNDEALADKEQWLLRVSNAGCIAPVIKRYNGSTDLLDIGGLPLGTGMGVRYGYQEKTEWLTKGDMVILTTDGVVEANNRQSELFGFERLEATIATGPTESATAMLNHIKRHVKQFIQNTDQHDDLTIIVIQV